MTNHTAEITQTAADLIRFKTVDSNNTAIHACMAYVRDYFASVSGLHIQQYEFEGMPTTIVANRVNTKSFDVLLNGHIDVVPAPDAEFEPRQAGGKLYGRGACDMKASLAAMMAVMKHVAPTASISVGLMIVSDEEVGGFNGTARMVQEGYRGSIVIIPDDMGNLELTTKEKGILQLDVTFKGAAAHSCEPWKGQSAIDALVAFAAAVRKQFPQPKAETWTTTCNIGLAQGGAARNQLAEQATASLDIRFTEKHSADSLFAAIQKLASKYNATVQKVLAGDAVNTPLDNPMVQQFAATAAQVLGHPVGYAVDHGASDARFFAAVDCPVLLFKPPSQGMHADNEAVDLAGLAQFYQILAQYCQEITTAK